TQGKAAVPLEIVGFGDQSAQVALKTAVRAMHEATLEEAFALDFRIRMILREPAPPAGTFDNPWSADYVCDAFADVCRALWPEDGLWRPIMERLVHGTTPRRARRCDRLGRAAERSALVGDARCVGQPATRTGARSRIGGARRRRSRGGTRWHRQPVAVLEGRVPGQGRIAVRPGCHRCCDGRPGLRLR